MKKKYVSPILMMTEGHDISYGNSQGTQSGDSNYTWQISEDDQKLFWVSYDETDLPDMDTNGDFIITQDEFDAFMDL